MAELGDFWRDVKESIKELKAKHGVKCPECQRLQPKRDPTVFHSNDAKLTGIEIHDHELTKRIRIMSPEMYFHQQIIYLLCVIFLSPIIMAIAININPR